MGKPANSQTSLVENLFGKLEEQRDHRVLWVNVEKAINEAVLYLEENLGCIHSELDFSKRSLSLVEGKLREKWKMVIDQTISLSDDELVTLMKAVGVYIGETCARQLDGHWKIDYRHFITSSTIVIPQETEPNLAWVPVLFVIRCWDELFAKQQDCFIHEYEELESWPEE
jgi:hypothetical protein